MTDTDQVATPAAALLDTDQAAASPAAIHEAAHAAMCMILGGPVYHLALDESGDREGVMWWSTYGLAPHDAAAVYLAGPIAAIMSGRDPVAVWQHATDDLNNAARYALLALAVDQATHPTAAATVTTAGEAMAIIERDTRHVIGRVWPDLMRGAAALDQARDQYLTGVEFAAACGGHIEERYTDPHHTGIFAADRLVTIARCDHCAAPIRITRNMHYNATQRDMRHMVEAMAAIHDHPGNAAALVMTNKRPHRSK